MAFTTVKIVVLAPIPGEGPPRIAHACQFPDSRRAGAGRNVCPAQEFASSHLTAQEGTEAMAG